MSLKDDLIAAKALIDTPEKWARGVFEADSCFCALGAVSKATTGDSDLDSNWFVAPAKAAYDALTRQLPQPHGWVVDFNDDPATTHADVMALFDRAIEAAS